MSRDQARDLAAEDCAAVLEALPSRLLVLSPDLIMLQASDAYLQSTGRSRDQLLGRHLFEAFPDNPALVAADGVKNLRASLERVLATGRRDTMPVQRYDVTDETGAFRPRWWSTINVPVLDARGDVRLLLHRVEDVSDVVQLREASDRAGPVHDALRRRLREIETELLARNRELAAANEQLRETHRREQARSAALAGFAETMQRSLLTAPPQPDGLQIVARYRPAAAEARVGGDWFDAVRTPEGVTTLVVGDVAGHDREAAAAMAQLRNVLRGVAVTMGHPPAAVLSALDRALITLDTPALATVLLAMVEHAAHERGASCHTLRWSNAGHLPPLLLAPGRPAELLRRPADLLIGLDQGTARSDHTLRLEPGATVLLYTDGLVEHRDQDLDTGLDRLRAMAEAMRHQPLDHLCDDLLMTMAPSGEDDVALAAVRIPAQPALMPL